MTAVSPPPDVRVYSVGELTRAVKGLLEEHHPSVWVEGEVSNLARPASGHLYLTLKDEESSLRAMLFRGVALRIKFDLRDGMRVVPRECHRYNGGQVCHSGEHDRLDVG